MRFINKNNKTLFDAEGIFEVGEKVGFNFDNAPNDYAVFEILSIKSDKAVLGDPKLVIKEDVNQE